MFYSYLELLVLLNSLRLFVVYSNERVAKRGDELLKRKAAAVNLEDSTLIKKLFSLYLGNDSS